MLSEFIQMLGPDGLLIMQRISTSLVIGFLIGLEREISDKPAGLRTIILISVGACVFSLVSERMGGPNADPTRIASQIVTGIGFLGAGAILRGTKVVYGMTTAATVWGVAAVGMACGLGQISIAIMGTAAMLIVLVIFHSLSNWIDDSRSIQKYRIATHQKEVRFEQLNQMFIESKFKILFRDCYREHEEYVYEIKALGPIAQHDTMREKLLHLPDFRLLKS